MWSLPISANALWICLNGLRSDRGNLGFCKHRYRAGRAVKPQAQVQPTMPSSTRGHVIAASVSYVILRGEAAERGEHVAVVGRGPVHSLHPALMELIPHLVVINATNRGLFPRSRRP